MALKNYSIVIPLCLLFFLRSPDDRSTDISPPSTPGALGSAITNLSHQQSSQLDTAIVRRFWNRAHQRYQIAQRELMRLEAELKLIEALDQFCLQFNGREPDTTIYQHGDIDGDGSIDLLHNHVWVQSGTVHQKSWWMRGEETFLVQDITISVFGPRLEELFDWYWTDSLVLFTNATLNRIPLLTSDRFEGIDIVIARGLYDLKNAGYSISEAEYREYVTQYQGMVVVIPGDVNSISLIWFEPLKRFILYYAP